MVLKTKPNVVIYKTKRLMAMKYNGQKLEINTSGNKY